MNYRHAFHAGNFADVLKHVLLTRILVYLMRKPAPLRYIDTHAGLGWYDLGGPEAERTGEWRCGIGRLASTLAPPHVDELLAPYFDAVGSSDAAGRPFSYPGSPGLAQHLLRPNDRLILCEWHPDDAASLRQAMGRDKRAKVLMVDGYTALKAYVPPPERRGLVLMDPPFEKRDEFESLAVGIATAYRKWATGTYAVWYPIKDGGDVEGFFQAVRGIGIRQSCRIELSRVSGAGPALRGCGLFVVNPPHVLVDEAAHLLPFLSEALSIPDLPPFRGRIIGNTDEPHAG